jgi:hypothetical protein
LGWERGRIWGRGGGTEVVGWLAGDGDFLRDGPFAVVGGGLVVGLVDVVADAGFVEAFA